ncbi:MAG TPA: MFS transporter [Candidatus Limnocylindria bacterium]|jgi:MFS family permease|nr:MFS transporter [Candidatus Limnocylindria bacterium]
MRRLLPALDANGWRLVGAKVFRGYAFGLNAVVLGLYLADLRLAHDMIGFILSAALLGTLALTLVIALFGDRIGRRRLLVIGSALMLLAAVIPFVGANPVVLALIGLSGMVAVTSSESTGLQSVDQAALPQTVSGAQRTAAFAFYNLVAAAASALGALTVGPFVALGLGLGLRGAGVYTPAFVAYAIAGVVSTILALALDRRVEVGQRLERGFAIRRSRRTVAMLSALFSLDALAGGFVVQSYLAFWFAERWAADPGAVGLLFAASNVLAAVSFPVAAWLASRIGLIRTMVFSHIPANLFLIGAAIAPSLPAAVFLMLGRAALSSMDVPARQSYTMAVVDPDERTATAGVTSLARSVGQVLGPALAGLLLTPLGVGAPLVAGGLLKTTYDLSLFAFFRSRPTPEEASARAVPHP